MTDLPAPSFRTREQLLEDFGGSSPEQLKMRDFVYSVYGGEGGGAASVNYNNVAAIEGTTIEPTVDILHTLSYATPGDGGSGIYRRVIGPADIQSLDGAWWQLVPQGPLRVTQLGAVADANPIGRTDTWAGTDSEPAIKNALYRYIYEHGYGVTPNGSRVELPVGHVKLGRGTHVGYGHNSFQSGQLCGAGPGIGIMPVTNVVWDFTDEPAVSVQGGRGVRIRDMCFTGLNAHYWEDNGFGTTGYNGSKGDDTLLSTWYRPTWPVQATSRYAPACAIAIDPRTAPADPTYHYRDVDYPAAMGTVPQYSKAMSSNVVIENVDFHGCGQVAVVVHPNNDSDGNGDFIRMRNCLIYGVPVGISIGQTQARLTSLSSVDFGAVHTAITTRMHGRQNGVFTEAWNCHFSGIQIFDFQDTSVAGHITLNFYGEETWRIGNVDSSSSSNVKLIMHNCKLSFECQSESPTSPRGVPTTMIGGSGGSYPQIEINGGVWTNYIGCAMIDRNVTGISIAGTLLQPRDLSPTMQEKCFFNGTAGGLVFPQLGFNQTTKNIRPKTVYWNLDTGAIHGALLMEDYWRSSRKTCTPLWAERHGQFHLREQAQGVPVPNRVSTPSIGVGGITTASLSGLTLNTTWAGWPDASYMLYGPLPGDILLHAGSKSVFVCMTANTTTDVVTFKLLNNYKGTVPRDPISLADGQLFYVASLRHYSPEYPVYGIITSGSAVITDCGMYYDGAFSASPQVSSRLADDLAVGDWLVLDQSLTPYLYEYSCMITAIDETAKTITLSGPAYASSGGKRVRLGTFVRPGVS